MSLKITGGHARGRVLRAPVLDGVRPTSARVREALFSIVGQDQAGRTVLDAFGGSGLIGLEAWSRGARVTVCERRRKVWAAVVATGKSVGAAWEVLCQDVLVDPPGAFDGVFADPPYADDPVQILPVLGGMAREWLVYEAAATVECPESAGALVLDRVRSFGGTRLWVYR